jgi:hypothetical protein
MKLMGRLLAAAVSSVFILWGAIYYPQEFWITALYAQMQ